jgi:hypothetical protein
MVLDINLDKGITVGGGGGVGSAATNHILSIESHPGLQI